MSSEILATHYIAPKVVDLIHDSRKRVVLVTPYLKLWNHLENELKAATARKVSVSIIFRQDKQDEYRDLIQQLLGWRVSLYSFNMLHAKVYINESSCILTSMNLYDVSAQNSEEFAIRSSDYELVSRVWEYVDGLVRRSQPVSVDVGKKIIDVISKTASAVGAAKAAVAKALERPGHCIRCGKEMPYEFERPLCPTCHNEWAKYKNRDYVEKHCHSCGTWFKTSVAKPLCVQCFKNQL